MSQHTLWAVVAGFCTGVMWRLFFDWGISAIIFSFLCGFCFAMCAFCLRRTHGRDVLLIIAVGWCAMGCGMVRVALSDTHTDTALAAHVTTRVTLEGAVIGEPEAHDTYVQVVITAERVQGDDAFIADRVLVYAPRYPELVYGDRVRITGVLEYPEVIQQDDGRTFSYPDYLKKDGIHFTMRYPSIAVTSHEQGASLYGILFSIKRYFLDGLKAMLPEPHVSLLGGLVVGAKEALGKDLLDTFRAAGVVHIVVLSGYNISVIARAVAGVLAPFARIWQWSVGGLFIILFTMITGGSATIVRASIMGFLVFIAQASDRQFDALRALGVAALLMVLHNPYILAFDPSFQLSCLATFGLIVYAPVFERHLTFLPRVFGLREIIAATFATELFVLPLLLWMNGTLSIVAPLTNILILPAIPWTMLVGAVTGVIALCNTVLAYPLASITYGLLAYELWIVQTLASVPFAAVRLPALPLWSVALFYVTLMLGAYRIVSKRSPN